MLLARFLLLVMLGTSAAFTMTARAPMSAVGFTATAAAAPARAGDCEMGRGDKRTAKGKRKAKSHGISRPRISKVRKAKAAHEAATSEE